LIGWEAWALVVPKVGRAFLVCAPNREQAVFTVKAHAAILIAMAER